MADLEIDDDVRERFAYLFKPVTDFAKNFEIDIIELLQEYDNRTLSSDTGFNFVNAAAMLQGTTNVYGTRVDILHKAVTTFKAEFTKEPAKKKAHKNDQQNGEESGGEEMEMDEEGADKEGHMVDKTKKSRLNRSELEDHSFHASRSRIPGPVELERPNGIKVVVPDRLHHNLTKAVLNENGMIERTEDDGLSIFERFHVDKKSHYPIHISREREYQLMFLMPGSMMPLLSTEKRPVELLGNSGKFGDVDDYRTCRDFVVHNYALYCNPGGTFCYPQSTKVDPCQAITNKVRQFLQSAQEHNLLPMNCASQFDATSADFYNGRASINLVEICRRVSDCQTASEFIHRLSHHLTLQDNERRKTELHSQVILPSQEPPPLSLNDDYDNHDFSFAGISFNNEGEILARDSLAPGASDAGPVTRSRQAEVDGTEPRRSARLSKGATDEAVPLLNDEFELLDMYSEDVFKLKKAVIVKRNVSAQLIVRKRENQRRREAERQGKDYLPSFQQYMDTHFWTKDAKKKSKKWADEFELALARQKIFENGRRKAIKAELRKQHMEKIRMKRRGTTILPELGARAKKSMEILQQKVAESFQEAPDIDNDDYDDYMDDNDFVNHTIGRASSVPPLGDIIPDHPDGIGEELTKLNLTRKRSTNVQPLQLHNASFAQDFDVNPISSHPNQEDTIPTNASISAIVQVFLSRKWNIAVKRQPESQQRLDKWQKKMGPVLEELTDDFLAHDYGKMILDKFEGEIGRKLFFNEIIDGKIAERSRFFLALLMLTNRGTLIIYPPPLELDKENSRIGNLAGNVLNDFEVELLDDTEWQGDEMNRTGLFI